MDATQSVVSRQDADAEPHADGDAWRAQLVRADAAMLSERAGDLHFLIQQAMTLLGRVSASKLSAVLALAARLQALHVVLGGLSTLPQEIARGAPMPVIAGQIQAAIAALGGAVGPTGIVRSHPAVDPDLSQEIAQLESALAGILARLRLIMARLG